MLPWAESLWKKGLALLMFDFRGTSLSEGDKCTAGCYEPQDLRGALDYIESRPDCAGLPIGAFGFSMGGATVIMAAADDPRIQAIVSHGAYATLYGAIQQRCKHHFGPLAPIAERLIMRLGNRRKWFVASPFGVAPLKAVARLTPRPLLLLHGERDPIIPAHHARKLYAAATGPKELHMLPRSRHKRINRKIRLQAHERVVQFFCDHLRLTSSEVGAAMFLLMPFTASFAFAGAPQTPPIRNAPPKSVSRQAAPNKSAAGKPARKQTTLTKPRRANRLPRSLPCSARPCRSLPHNLVAPPSLAD